MQTELELIPIYPHGQLEESSLPIPVKESIKRWAEQRSLPRSAVIATLRDDTMMGCYCFTWKGCYYGVEYTDGHIHT